MLRRAIILSTLVVLGAGCGSGSFVGRRVDNFTAYYNTFYNARQAYRSGFETIAQRDMPVDRNRYLPLFVRPTGQTANRDFDSAVTKSADVLREHGDSKWVDDALLLIGKSYFYQENFAGALQKFREVIDRHSELEDEARFWLARTLITSRSYDEALLFLQESLAREGVPREWIGNFRLALGELYVQRQDWEGAATALSEGLDNAKNKEIAGRAQFLLGQVYETMARFNEAAEAYRNVQRYNPLYELDYAAQFSAIRVEGLHGDAARALRALRKMERDDKHFEYLDELRLLRGRIIQATGAADDAYSIYHDLLYDPDRQTALQGAIRGKVHYALAELYRDLDGDYVMASAHFDTAAQYVARPTTGSGATRPDADLYAPEAITDAEELKEDFGAFAGGYASVAEMDSLLWLGSLGQEEFDAKILEYRQERARAMEQERKEREARLLEQQFRQSANTQNAFQDRNLPPSKVNPPNLSDLQRAGFLFHKDPVRVEEGKANFVAKWGDRPRVQNWRRIEAVRNAPSDEVEAAEVTVSGVDLENPATLPEIDTSRIPRDSLARALMVDQRAVARYELGNALFIALNMPDSAAVWYRKVIEETPDEPVAKRAYYALAEVQRALGDTLSAERLDEEIIERYPDSEFARKILIQRGELQEESEPDSAQVALDLYRLVYEEWQEWNRDDILNQMLLVAASYPGTDAAAKSLLAGAQFHLEKAGSDTSAVLAPLPVLLPDSVLGVIWPEKMNADGEAVPGGTVVENPEEAAPADSRSGQTPVKEGAEPSGSGDAVSAEFEPVESGLDSEDRLPGKPTADSTSVEVALTPAARDSVAANVSELVNDSTRVADMPDATDRAAAAVVSDTKNGLAASRPDSLVGAALDSLVTGEAADSLAVSRPDSLAADEMADNMDLGSIAGGREVPPDSTAAPTPSDSTDAPDSLSLVPGTANAGAPDSVETVPERLAERPANRLKIVVDDLFDAVIRDFPRTPYAERARSFLAVLAELRTPPVVVDSTALAAGDSTASAAGDSTAVAAGDSTAMAMTDSSAQALSDSIATIDPNDPALAAGDSTRASDVNNPALAAGDSTRAIDADNPDLEAVDSAALARQAPPEVAAADSALEQAPVPPRDLVPDSTGGLFDAYGNPVKEVVTIDSTELAQALAQSAGEDEAGGDVVRPVDPPEFPTIQLTDDGSEKGAPFERSTSLQPLSASGEPLPGVVGWTILSAKTSSLDEARRISERLTRLLEDSGQPILILADSDPAKTSYAVSWGLFAGRTEAEDAYSNLEFIPFEESTFLLLGPADRE